MEYGIALGLVALSLIIGFWWKGRQGRVVAVSGPTLSLDYREKGKTTLVQFTTEICAPCAALKPRLERIAVYRSDVAYRQVDAVEHSELASTLSIRSTPTTLIVSPDGSIRARINGIAPDQVFLDAIDGKIDTTPTVSEETTI